MDPEALLLAMLDHPHQADEIAAAYGRGDLDDLLHGGEQPPDDTDAPSPAESSPDE